MKICSISSEVEHRFSKPNVEIAKLSCCSISRYNPKSYDDYNMLASYNSLLLSSDTRKITVQFGVRVPFFHQHVAQVSRAFVLINKGIMEFNSPIYRQGTKGRWCDSNHADQNIIFYGIIDINIS